MRFYAQQCLGRLSSIHRSMLNGYSTIFICRQFVWRKHCRQKHWKCYPSFIKDSPSMMVLSFLLAPSSFRRATTATGSVALRSPPSNNDVFQLQSYGKVSCRILKRSYCIRLILSEHKQKRLLNLQGRTKAEGWKENTRHSKNNHLCHTFLHQKTTKNNWNPG